ncbi:heme lyase CcmF/NrfE family subunit [Zooshikella ganghwensis]|uniref:heme lyase CcmF/NrfE family subunit n=1 Tax=Zooshikella ganghwensis TaxID=202772 RepID=UPI0003F91FD5|nr:heme lyase CcmF/NrfE family subunit [Zooshikella ganghwensis]
MIAEIGHFAVILAFCLSLVLAIVPMMGSVLRQTLWMAMGKPLAVGLFGLLLIAFVSLGYCFATDDFSVAYVAHNSNSLLPLPYKISAIWGAHEGSFLLWCLMAAGWTLAVAVFSQSLPRVLVARVLSILGLCSVGFLAFLLFTSNPFKRLLPHAPIDGRDLNPLLQDFGLIIHPPMLYMGYVGFSVVFAFAIAALLGGRLDAAWARWSRPWTTIAWSFLTVGIALGSWWAYYELGWGGWWFWDPVENASFMPWLMGTALMHSLAVTEKRGVFKSWTVFLAIATFSLSLLGAFLVRSGVLTSVHAFATDPERGVFILAFLLFVVGGSLLLYALRAPTVQSSTQFSLWSRETLLLLNNIVLTIATALILVGTLYPLLAEALSGSKLSVGPPYFNQFFPGLMVALALLLGIGITVNWKHSRLMQLFGYLRWALLGALVLGSALSVWHTQGWLLPVWIGLVVVIWIALSALTDLFRKLKHQSSLWRGLRKLTLSYYGMHLGHMGFAICILGVVLTSFYSEERDLRMAPGDQLQLSGLTFTFMGTQQVTGPNYKADQGEIKVTNADGDVVTRLYPQKRQYQVQRSMMTEAAIDPGITRDLYVALGEPLGEGAWAVRVHYKAFVRCIWLGALVMALGGVLAVLDKRYRRRRVVVSNEQTAETVYSHA